MASPDGNPMMDKTPECPASGSMPARRRIIFNHDGASRTVTTRSSP